MKGDIRDISDIFLTYKRVILSPEPLMLYRIVKVVLGSKHKKSLTHDQ